MREETLKRVKPKVKRKFKKWCREDIEARRREVWRLHFFMRLDEIAQELGISKKTVCEDLKRMREQKRELGIDFTALRVEIVEALEELKLKISEEMKELDPNLKVKMYGHLKDILLGMMRKLIPEEVSMRLDESIQVEWGDSNAEKENSKN